MICEQADVDFFKFIPEDEFDVKETLEQIGGGTGIGDIILDWEGVNLSLKKDKYSLYLNANTIYGQQIIFIKIQNNGDWEDRGSLTVKSLNPSNFKRLRFYGPTDNSINDVLIQRDANHNLMFKLQEPVEIRTEED